MEGTSTVPSFCYERRPSNAQSALKISERAHANCYAKIEAPRESGTIGTLCAYYAVKMERMFCLVGTLHKQALLDTSVLFHESQSLEANRLVLGP